MNSFDGIHSDEIIIEVKIEIEVETLNPKPETLNPKP